MLIESSIIQLFDAFKMKRETMTMFLSSLWHGRPIKFNFCTSCARKSLSEWPPVTPHSSTQILNRSKTLLTLKFYFDSILNKRLAQTLAIIINHLYRKYSHFCKKLGHYTTSSIFLHRVIFHFDLDCIVS